MKHFLINTKSLKYNLQAFSNYYIENKKRQETLVLLIDITPAVGLEPTTS